MTPAPMIPTVTPDRVLQLIQGVMHDAAPRLGSRRVVLFGSRAQGTARSRSDYDVAVVGDTPLPLKDFYEIETALEELPTLFRIDWVDMARVDPLFKQRALQHQKIIYESQLDHQ